MAHPLYEAAQLADDAWQTALEAAFGRHAGDARYDLRGTSSPNLVNLSVARTTACNSWITYLTQHA
jgi:hypothetical protein